MNMQKFQETNSERTVLFDGEGRACDETLTERKSELDLGRLVGFGKRRSELRSLLQTAFQQFSRCVNKPAKRDKIVENILSYT